ncbi:MAG: helix-turn-helix transcriptional regulator [Candidatus Woesebacteria bacterium]
MKKLFGIQLRDERKKQGLTVQMISEACGVSRSYITLIENGKRLPGKKILPKIAVALHLKTTIVLNWYLEHISEKMQNDLKISE